MHINYTLLFVLQIVGIFVLTYVLHIRGSLGRYTYGLFKTLEDLLADFPKAQAKAIARVQELAPDNADCQRHLKSAEDSFLNASNFARMKDRVSAFASARYADQHLVLATNSAESEAFKEELRQSLQP